MAEIFTITVDGEDHELTEDNHTVALFRQTPEYDYIHLQPESEEEQKHILIFRHQWLCHWLADLAINPSDKETLTDRKQELGSFALRYGFNSKVMLEDSANDFEIEYYQEGLLSDLRSADGVPEDWIE